MGLAEYSYIYALAYHDHLLSSQTRLEIFSDGGVISPQASIQLRECLIRQLEAMEQVGPENQIRAALEAELKQLEGDTTRLIWQDGLPQAIRNSLMPYRDQIDRLF